MSDGSVCVWCGVVWGVCGVFGVCECVCVCLVGYQLLSENCLCE